MFRLKTDIYDLVHLKNKKELRHVRGREVRGSFNCQTGNSVVSASQKFVEWFDYFVNTWFESTVYVES